MPSDARKVIDKMGRVLGRAWEGERVPLMAAAFEGLARLAREAADEAREQGVPAVEAAVACVLDGTARWATFPEVPAELVALAAGVLRGRNDEAAWAEAVAAVLTAEGVEHEPLAAVGRA